MAGTLAGTDAWFTSNHGGGKESSAHYGVGLQGQMHQYVTLPDTAYSNGIREPGNRWPFSQSVAVNPQCVSIETEDLGNNDQPVTEEQYQATLILVRRAIAIFDTIEYLMGHYIISPISRANCPGRRWRQTGRLGQLAHDAGIPLYA